MHARGRANLKLDSQTEDTTAVSDVVFRLPFRWIALSHGLCGQLREDGPERLQTAIAVFHCFRVVP